MLLIVEDKYTDFVNHYRPEFVLKNKNDCYGMWKIRVGNLGFKALARVLVELHINKEIPKHILVDHIDRNTSNNKLSNLRLTTHKLNLNNKSGMSPLVEHCSSYRLDYGKNSLGNRIRTPRFYAKTKTQIEQISNYFHSLCQGNILSPWSIEDKNEFMTIFKDSERYDSWIKTYGSRIRNNLHNIQQDYYVIEDFTGNPFGTTVDKL